MTEALYSMLRASGPEIRLPGRILAGLLLGNDRYRPSGRPNAGGRADFEVVPTRIRPKSGSEYRFPARKHYNTNAEVLGPWMSPTA